MSRADTSSTIGEMAISTWREHAIPWLISASVHCGVLIVLGLLMAQGAFLSVGNGNGHELSSSVYPSHITTEYYDDDASNLGTPEGDPAHDHSSAKRPAATAAGPAARRPVQPARAQAAARARALSTVLSGVPPVDLAGLLPAAGPALGGGALEGGGIGTAKTATRGSQGSKNAPGGYAQTGVFGLRAQGYKFVYVFDRSGSMGGHGGAPPAAAQGQLIKSLHDLGQTHQFQIIFYNERPQVFTPVAGAGRLVFGTEDNKYQAERFVQSIIADGATEHEDALAMALRMAPDVIFFLTDADEPRLNARQLAHIARINKGTQINAIEFGYARKKTRRISSCGWPAKTAASTPTSTSRHCPGRTPSDSTRTKTAKPEGSPQRHKDAKNGRSEKGILEKRWSLELVVYTAADIPWIGSRFSVRCLSSAIIGPARMTPRP